MSNPLSLAQVIAASIEADLRTRAGFCDLWARLDPETEEGIRRRWAELVTDALSSSGGAKHAE